MSKKPGRVQVQYWRCINSSEAGRVGSCYSVRSNRESPAQPAQASSAQHQSDVPAQPSDQTVDVYSLAGSINPSYDVGRVAIVGFDEVRVHVEVEVYRRVGVAERTF